MAGMYKIEPILGDVHVMPDVPMYKMESFHKGYIVTDEETYDDDGDSDSSVFDIAEFDAQQKDLMKKWAQLKHTMEYDHRKKTNSKSDKKGNKTEGKNEKSKKEAKKAEKKADKKAAKKENKKPSKPVTEAKPKKTAAVSAPDNANHFAFKPPANSATVIKTDTTADKYIVHDYKNNQAAELHLQLECGVADIKWLESIIKLGKLRGVEIGSKTSGSRTVTVKTSKSGVVSLQNFASNPINGRVAVWKALGQILNVYDTLDGLAALQTDYWLQSANDVLQGHTTTDEVSRALSRRLGEVDFLGAHGVVLLPDLILKSLVNKERVANNVELWRNRVSIAQ